MILFSQFLISYALGLSWNASTSANVIGYRIYEGYSSGNYFTHFDTGIGTNSSIQNLPGNILIFFAATSFTSTAESGFSNEVKVQTPNVRPTSLTLGLNGVINCLTYAGGLFELQRSDDLLHWTVLRKFNGSDSPLEFGTCLDAPYKFFRLRDASNDLYVFPTKLPKLSITLPSPGASALKIHKQTIPIAALPLSARLKLFLKYKPGMAARNLKKGSQLLIERKTP